MANWIMNTEKIHGEIIVRIGALCIASISFMKDNTPKGWKAHVRFMDSNPQGKTCESVSEALKLIHEYLNSPPIERH